MSLVGLDIGTSAAKAILLDERGVVLGQARRGYPVRTPSPGRFEVDAQRVWRATRRVIVELAAVGAAADSPVRAMCAGGSGDEVVAVDRAGRPVAPVIMAIDGRSAAEGAALATRRGSDALFRRSGLWDLATTPAARWAWMTRHEPDAAGRTHRLLSWPEWVMTRLGLPAVTDPTLAARTLAVEVATGRYVPGGAGIPDGLLSPIVATGEAVAPLPSRVAASLGLPAGVRYVVGGFDQAMATLGAGVVDAGVAHDGSGSWEAVSAQVAGRVPAPASLPREWSVGPAAVGGRLEAMTSWPGGLALRWVSALATGGVPGDGSVARAIASMPADLPRLAVSMAQEPGRAGAIVGLDLSVRHGDLVLGVLVGLAHRLRHALADLDAAGAPVRLLRVTGGGARSGRWLQLKADATGTPVERPVVGEAGAFAAAVLAGSAIGALPDPRDAVRALVRVAARFEPDPAGMAWHDAHAEAQTALADALEGLDR